MNIDIIMVSYNSRKYIEGCMNSILSSDYDLKKIGIYIYDNKSSDDTIEIFKKIKKENINKFRNFEIIEGKHNLGFGRGNNIAAKVAKGDYLFFLNIDCEIRKDTLSKIEEEIIKRKQENVGIFELKQEPYEHPKYYDPMSKETKWASGACMIIPRKLFYKVGGFDKKIFMYCEDVEISFHIRKIGYKIIYLNDISITHYSYSRPYEFKKSQYVNSASNNLYLRFKYGKFKDIIKGYALALLFLKQISDNKEIPNEQMLTIKKEAKHNVNKMFWLGVIEWFKRIKYLLNTNKVDFKFNGFEYSGVRDGAFYTKKEIKTNPLVSIIVRTCGRPNVLRETLISIKNQTYKNIEVIIVEDGSNLAESLIKKEFKDLNIKYYSFEKNVGRCKAGNKALSMATGKYFNFLDDDDLFYDDHVEVLVSELESSEEKVAYASSFETPIIVHSKTPYKYTLLNEYVLLSTDFNILKLLYANITPIQCVMFSKEVYEKCGGFDEKLDALEDWDLWIRYGLAYPFKFIKKTTSIYRVPGDTKEVEKRSKFLNSYLNDVRKKHKDAIAKVRMNDVMDFYNYIVTVSTSSAASRIEKIKRILKRGK